MLGLFYRTEWKKYFFKIVLFSVTSLRGEPPAEELPPDLCSSSKAFHSTNTVDEHVFM